MQLQLICISYFNLYFSIITYTHQLYLTEHIIPEHILSNHKITKNQASKIYVFS